MLTLRAKIFIISGLSALIILGISLFLIFVSGKNNIPAQTDPAEVGDEAVVPQTGVVPGASVSGQPLTGLAVAPKPREEAIKNNVRQLAKIFLERYGTYSSDNNYQNIREVEELASASLWKKLSARLSVKPATGSFVGVTSRVISSELVEWKNTTAVVSANLIRTEEKNGAVASSQQSASVSLIKIGDVWLVDKFEVK